MSHKRNVKSMDVRLDKETEQKRIQEELSKLKRE
jgi:hypothetical protein